LDCLRLELSQEHVLRDAIGAGVKAKPRNVNSVAGLFRLAHTCRKLVGAAILIQEELAFLQLD